MTLLISPYISILWIRKQVEEEKASSKPLDFKRIDYPETDPPKWNRFVTIRLENGDVKVGELPFKFWLLPPNAPPIKRITCGLVVYK